MMVRLRGGEEGGVGLRESVHEACCVNLRVSTTPWWVVLAVVCRTALYVQVEYWYVTPLDKYRS
jgi:hypothetical protein